VIGYLEEIEPRLSVKGIMVWGVTRAFDLLAYERSVAMRMESTL
jgi:hypothetical protein